MPEQRYADNSQSVSQKAEVFWMAEAENWSRLSNESFRGEPEQKSVAACCERSRLSDGLGREAE